METNEGRSESLDPEPKIIGLTGGIGSGKTTVARQIEQKGFPVYYSDIRAKEIVNESESLKSQIISLLGAESYDAAGNYDRKAVAEKVFENTELLQQLNGIIHPAVRTDFENWVQQQHLPYIFKETALLFELGLDEDCYKSILVTAEDNIRIKRVMERDGKTYREVSNVMEQQLPEKDKIKKADFIIYNNETLEQLEEQVDVLMENLAQLTV